MNLGEVLLTGFTGAAGVIFFSFAWAGQHLADIQAVFGMICTGIITVSTVLKTWKELRTKKNRRSNNSNSV